MNAKLVQVQLETNHHNRAAAGWYAYFEGDPGDPTPELLQTLADQAERVGPLSVEPEPLEEVPNSLSKRTGLRRFFFGGGC